MAADYYPIVVIGGGTTGLSAAYHVGDECLVLERNSRIGGTSRSEQREGFLFDYAGQAIWARDRYAEGMLATLLGENLYFQGYKVATYHEGRYLPALGKARRAELPLPGRVAAEYARSLREAEGPQARGPAGNLEEYLYRRWGAGIAEAFAIPYQQKLWPEPLTHLAVEWADEGTPVASLEEGILGALCESGMDGRPYRHFLYPLHGGMQAVADALAARVRQVRTRSRVTQIDVRHRTVTINGAEQIGYERLISTMPLPELAHVVPEMPQPVREAIAGLVNVPLYCVYLAVDRPARTDKHRIYYPNGEFVMHRATVQSNLSPHAAPEATSSYILEITRPAEPGMTGETLRDRAIEDAIKARLISPRDEILVAEIRTLDYAYPVPTAARAGQVAQVVDWLRQQDIYTAGRFGTWEPLSWGGAILAGQRVAQAASQAALARSGKVSVPVVPAIPAVPPAVRTGASTETDQPEPAHVAPGIWGPDGSDKQ